VAFCVYQPVAQSGVVIPRRWQRRLDEVSDLRELQAGRDTYHMEPLRPARGGEDGDPGVAPAQVRWMVAEGADGIVSFPSLSTALASINDNSALKPYLVKIAPGLYDESGPVALKNFGDVEGSGQGVTTLACSCSGDSESAGFMTADNIIAEIRHLTIRNTGGGFMAAVSTKDVAPGQFSMLHVTAIATGGGIGVGVYNLDSSPSMINVIATGTGGWAGIGVLNANGSSPTDSTFVAPRIDAGGEQQR
jgi:hypothetical protein